MADEWMAQHSTELPSAMSGWMAEHCEELWHRPLHRMLLVRTANSSLPPPLNHRVSACTAARDPRHRGVGPHPRWAGQCNVLLHACSHSPNKILVWLCTHRCQPGPVPFRPFAHFPGQLHWVALLHCLYIIENWARQRCMGLSHVVPVLSA